MCRAICPCGEGLQPLRGGDDGVPNKDPSLRTSQHNNSSYASSCDGTKGPRRYTILRSTTGRTSRCTKGHTILHSRHSTMGRAMCTSKGCNILCHSTMRRLPTGCSACSRTMNCLCCTDRNSSRSCSPGHISNRTDSRRLSLLCLLTSGRI